MVDKSLATVVSAALREDRTVELRSAEKHGFVVVVDGVPIAPEPVEDGLPIEHLEYPLDRVNLSEDAEQVVDEIRSAEQRRRNRRRMRRLNTDSAVDAHGEDLPIESD